MKITSIIVVPLFSVLCFSAMAQVDDIPNNEIPSASHTPETTVNEDKPLLFEHEIKAKRDSIQVKSVPAAPTKTKADHTKPSAGKEEDALSFNFLYYIIQKFKIPDLVDD